MATLAKIKAPGIQSPKRENLLHFLATALVIGVMGFGMVQAMRSSLFFLKKVEVEPLSNSYPLSREQVLALAKVTVGSIGLFSVDLKPIESHLLKHPWVKGVVLGKRFPDTLSIKIVERAPIALLTEGKGKISYLESDGTIFEDQSMVYPADLPILTGFAGSDLRSLRKVNVFVETWFSPKVLPGVKLSSVSYDEKLGLRALISYPMKNQQQMRTVLEMGLDIEEASTIPQRRLLGILEYLSGRSMQASKIWLGSGKKIVVKISRGP